MGKKTTVFALSSFSADIAVTGFQARDSGCLVPIPMRYSNRNDDYINDKQFYC